MGRIITPVTVANAADKSLSIRCDALVDTGAAPMVLPSAWKIRLGPVEHVEHVELELANALRTTGEICGPVRLQIEGFRPIFTEVLFVAMDPSDGIYEPLLGYIPLEQSGAAVDMLGHRLVHARCIDLKRLAPLASYSRTLLTTDTTTC